MLAEVYDGTAVGGDAGTIVESALRALASASAVRKPAPGCGETVHGSAPGVVVGAVPGVVVGAVIEGGHVYHAVVTAA